MLRILSLTVLFSLWVSGMDNAPFLHPLFNDHAVLQRGRALPVWGWSTPGDHVTVTFAEQTLTADADASGRWQVTFTAIPAGGPYALMVKGAKEVTANDLLVGDVWLCSGQSNMEFQVSQANNFDQERNAADFPQIRQFTGTKRFSLTPEILTGGGWSVCTPGNVGNFTAVGYFFGREVHREAKIPIGLINASWGGTRIESWTSRSGLAALERTKGELQQLGDLSEATKKSEFDQLMAAWWTAADPAADAALTNFSDQAWGTMDVPGLWEDKGLPGFDGVAWFRRTFEVPAEAAGKEAKLFLGPIDDRDVTSINGREVGHLDVWNQQRQYSIPAGVLTAGTNTIAIRVLDTGGGGGIFGQVEDLHVDIGETKIALAGKWRLLAGKPLGQLPAMPTQLDNANVITALSNGMIEPLVPAALAGAIWYQGESNASIGSQYDLLLPALIADWRTRFQRPDLPFGIVQLANFMPTVDTPIQESGWAYLRDTQLKTFRTVPGTGMAVITDIGDASDIHPRNKQDVGRRLAAWALHDVYGRNDVVRCGPLFKAATVEGATLRVSLDYAAGLQAKGDLRGFAIAGNDANWVAAEARIDGETLIVSSPQVAAPTKVRYGWSNNPPCPLFNGVGLPASPFASDL